MSKIPKRVTLTNIILVFILVIFGVVAFNQFNTRIDLENEIEVLNEKLESEKEYNTLYDKTKQFINLSNNGEHLSLLTGSAKKELENQLDKEGKENHIHGENLVEKVEINNVYATKTDQDSGESYAIYRVFYGIDSDFETPMSMKQILTLSLHAKWKEVDGKYKVYNYEIRLLEDSLNKYLKELMEQEGEKENEAS